MNSAQRIGVDRNAVHLRYGNALILRDERFQVDFDARAACTQAGRNSSWFVRDSRVRISAGSRLLSAFSITATLGRGRGRTGKSLSVVVRDT